MKTLEELRQTVDIDEITKQVKRRRGSKPSDKPKEKTDYLGVCYFLDGNAWLYIDGDTRCIGKEKDIQEACKLYNTDVENPSDIKNAVIRWRRESKEISGASGEVAKREVFEDKKSPIVPFSNVSKVSRKETKPLKIESYASTGHARGHKELSIPKAKEHQLVLMKT